MRDTCNRRAALCAAGGAILAGLAGCTGGQPEEMPVVEVGPGGALVFDPAELTISTGTTVRWVWESSGHNIVVENQPSGASWQGSVGGGSTLYDRGHELTFTFETTGSYEYYCNPHRSAGMTGSVTVE